MRPISLNRSVIRRYTRWLCNFDSVRAGFKDKNIVLFALDDSEIIIGKRSSYFYTSRNDDGAKLMLSTCFKNTIWEKGYLIIKHLADKCPPHQTNNKKNPAILRDGGRYRCYSAASLRSSTLSPLVGAKTALKSVYPFFTRMSYHCNSFLMSLSYTRS
jgi:hypothetical protein